MVWISLSPALQNPGLQMQEKSSSLEQNVGPRDLSQAMKLHVPPVCTSHEEAPATWTRPRATMTRETILDTFGYGNKYDFTKTAPKNPPPNNYNIESLFIRNKKKSKGKSFGLSR